MLTGELRVAASQFASRRQPSRSYNSRITRLHDLHCPLTARLILVHVSGVRPISHSGADPMWTDMYGACQIANLKQG